MRQVGVTASQVYTLAFEDMMGWRMGGVVDGTIGS